MSEKQKPKNITALLVAIALCAAFVISDSMQIELPSVIRVAALISAILLIGFYVISNAGKKDKDD